VSGVALVTGAARGIGLETVRGLAAAGMHVVLGARDVAAGEAARAGLGELAGSVEVARLDVTDPDSIAACVAAIGVEHGRLDVLVNNGGISLDRGVSVLDADFDTVRETLETNLFGAWRLTLMAVGLLRAAAPALVINVSSGMGQLDDMQDGSTGYRVSKLALNGVTRMMSVALAGDDVSVVSVCPGWVLTEMGGDGAYLSIEEGADTILWLATLPAAEVPTGAFYKRRQAIAW
jgi:NAD(P)-dependent dehydrogenase (short-subunit alcohol dehydrogenase family)